MFAHAADLRGALDIAHAQHDAALNLRRDAVDIRLRGDGAHVGDVERGDGAAVAVAKTFAGIDADGVGAHAAEVGEDFLLGTFAQRVDQHHGNNPDDDAQHGEQAAHPVRGQRVQRHARGFAQLHECCAHARAGVVAHRRGVALARGNRGGGVFVGTVGSDAAIGNFHDALRVRGDLGVMRDQNDGVPGGVEFLQDAHDFFAGVAVERAGGFVGQNHAAAVHQRAGDGDALLLAAGELGRVVFEAFFQPQTAQQMRGALMAGVVRGASVNGGNFYVFAR